MLTDELQRLAQQPVVLYVNVFPFRIEAGQILYLILQRRDDVVLPGVWQPVSGKLSAGGSIRKSFTDQVQKKTGLAPTQIVPIDHLISYYDHHYDCVMMVPCAGALMPAGEMVLDAGLHTQGRWVPYLEIPQYIDFGGQLMAYELLNITLTRRLAGSQVWC